MNTVASLLVPECTRTRVSARSKKRLLELAAELLAEHHVRLDARELFDALLARERLGSTGLGEGVGLPHCRMPGCTEAVAALVTLDEPIDFDSPDDTPVDIAFLLVVPEDGHAEHLQILAGLAGGLKEADYREALRAADSDRALYTAALALPGQAAAG